ncbi:hypothetical protein C8J57DRAFT_1606436 [Mycena rebaudengoi]|nr:hypothetical protein C8J57DRAFT_1606436 [Mycena rebaudengoi]
MFWGAICFCDGVLHVFPHARGASFSPHFCVLFFYTFSSFFSRSYFHLPSFPTICDVLPVPFVRYSLSFPFTRRYTIRTYYSASFTSSFFTSRSLMHSSPFIDEPSTSPKAAGSFFGTRPALQARPQRAPTASPCSSSTRKFASTRVVVFDDGVSEYDGVGDAASERGGEKEEMRGMWL